MAIFIMGIGMLSVLAMFPAAADMMGRAISNSQLAEGLVNARAMDDGVDWTSSAYNVYITAPKKNPGRTPSISSGWWNNMGATEFPTFLFLDQYASLNSVYEYSGCPVEVACLVDPTSTVTPNQIAGRFFTCNSDVVLNKAGQANKDDDGLVVPVDREGKFTISFFYSKPMPVTYPNYIRKNILLFKDRSQSLSVNDFTYFNASPLSANQLTVAANANVSFKTRQWIMVTDSLPNIYPTNVDFLEIQSVDESVSGFVTLEVNPAINFNNLKSIYLLKDVVRVALIGS